MARLQAYHPTAYDETSASGCSPSSGLRASRQWWTNPASSATLHMNGTSTKALTWPGCAASTQIAVIAIAAAPPNSQPRAATLSRIDMNRPDLIRSAGGYPPLVALS